MPSTLQKSIIALATACALTTLAAPAAASPKEEEVTVGDDARRHFTAGVALLQDPDGTRWEDAFLEFKAAFAASPSPKILGNIGLCAMKLERDGEAIEAYTRYIREVADIDAEERTQIARDLQTLSVTVVRVSLTVAPAAPGLTVLDRRIPVRGETMFNAYPVAAGAANEAKLEVGIRPGHHEVVVRAPGYEDAVWEFEAYGGTRESRALTLRPKPNLTTIPAFADTHAAPASGRSNLLPWMTTGVGAAMVGVGAITGIAALGKVHDLEKKCPNDQCPANSGLEADRSSARALVRATDVLLIGGGVLAGAGITWLLLQGHPSTSAEKFIAGGMCTSSGCMGSLGRSF